MAALYWFVATAAAVGAQTCQAQLALNASAGTNIVNQLGDNFGYAGSVLLPIVLAILLICGVVGVYKRLSRKAGVST